MDKFALVPIKPTAEMLEGFDGLRLTRIDEYVAELIWHDMIMAYIEQSSAPSETLARFSIVIHADGSTCMTIQATDGDPDALLATAIAALQAEQREVSACPHHSSNEEAPMRTPHMAPPGALGQPPKSGTAVKKTATDAAASESTCPFCTGASEYQGSPEDAFCERHLRLYRKASAA